ncbi:MAG: nucleotide exchange factor GrpE [Candidatus Gracilibacteria bacterium]|nr:nucleotide exchange factor GrpE [Candidatus Gracilibacteria bacterium]
MTQQDNNINPNEENQDSTILEEIAQTAADETISSGDGKTPTQDDIIAGLQASLARSQADYQNLLMRVERDKADMVHFLSAKILLPLLSQVDNLERAIKLKEGIEGDGFVDGVRSLYAGFQKYLESQGVIAFDSIGQEVDPDRHDVMTEMVGESGKIIQEFEKGYMLRDRVLRHAKVVVGNGQ